MSKLRYGPPKRSFPIPLYIVKEKLEKVHPDITIDENTYFSMSKPANFFQEGYGWFTTTPYSLISNNCQGHPQKRKERIEKYWEEMSPEKKEELLLKSQQTSIERYGYDNPSKSPEIINKIKETNIAKYGANTYIQTEEGREKAIQASKDKHNGIHHTKDPEVIKKKKATMMKNYGVDNPLKSKEIMSRVKKTNIERYGFDNPTKNKDILLKSMKSCNKAVIKQHWKDNSEIVCVGGYESSVIDYLNLNKIEYIWQIHFSLPNNKTYICDLYLINEDKYVEIKGYFRKDALEKWTLFQTMYPNSELWDKEKLKTILK